MELKILNFVAIQTIFSKTSVYKGLKHAQILILKGWDVLDETKQKIWIVICTSVTRD